MRVQFYKWFQALLAVGIFCAVMGSPVAAQEFSGQRTQLSNAEWVRHNNFSQLPLRPLLTNQSFSYSLIEASKKDGDYRSYQHPESAKNFSLSSYGITSFKDIRLEGKFQYRKQLQNGVGWKLSRDVYHSPYYLANIRPGDWNNDRYELNINGGTRFFEEHLLLGFGVDYKVERLARYNDPRPSIDFYNLFLKSQIGWNWKNHTLGIYAGTGDTDEKGSVRNYAKENDSFGKTKYNILTIKGFGSFSLRHRDSYEKHRERKEAGITYRYSGRNVDFTAEAVMGRQDTDFSRRESIAGTIVDNVLGTYNEETFLGNLFVSVPMDKYTLQVQSNTFYADGYDKNKTFGGANFFSKHLKQKLRVFLHKDGGNFSVQAGAGYKDRSLTDRNASHAFEFEHLATDLSAQYSHTFGSRTLTIIPGISYRTSLSSSININPEQENYFTQYVISPDYYLHTSDVLGLRGGFQIKQNFKNLAVALLIDYQRQSILNEGTLFGNPEYIPGKTRNTFTLTLQFFH